MTDSPIQNDDGEYVCGYPGDDGRCTRTVGDEWSPCWQHENDDAELVEELINFLKSLEKYALSDPTRQSIANKLDELDERDLIDER